MNRRYAGNEAWRLADAAFDDEAIQLAAELGITLPATALSRDLYDKLIAEGNGDLDHAALIKAIDPDG